MKEILNVYEAASRQAINFQKSPLTVSPVTSQEQTNNLKNLLQLGGVRRYSQYLGLPSTIGRNKKAIFGGIKEKVLKRLAGWQEKLFSARGKEVLIKAIVQAIPTYPMSLFRLPVGLCKDLERYTARFWQGESSTIDKSTKFRKSIWSLKLPKKINIFL